MPAPGHPGQVWHGPSVSLFLLQNVGINNIYLIGLLWRLNAFICVKYFIQPRAWYVLYKWSLVKLFPCHSWPVCPQSLRPGLCRNLHCGGVSELIRASLFLLLILSGTSLPASVLYMYQWAGVLILPAPPADAARPVCVHLRGWLLPRSPLLYR